jgi:NAD(P)-dependent dehydrogenase (short-subunit alcohol dehydrogenase family)
MELIDKVAVVTGGASGIGAACCRAFAAAGARVAVVDRNEVGARAVATEIGGVSVACDVGDEMSVNEMIRAVEKDIGPVDVCFNNAGIATGGDPLSATPDVWNEQWAVNVMAHVYAVRAVLPGMLERGSGYILHTASMAGILTSHGNAVYATTKHAVVGLAEWLSITYHHRGIRVSLLAPLGVRTPMLGDTSSPFATMVAGPIKEPEEVADMVVSAIGEERFLILTDEIAQEWIGRKTSDIERWLRGMRRVQERMETTIREAGGPAPE